MKETAISEHTVKLWWLVFYSFALGCHFATFFLWFYTERWLMVGLSVFGGYANWLAVKRRVSEL